jgi:oligopeptide/dipeptide ABC transporter ATP-binding protein
MAAAQELTPSFLSVRGLRTTFPGVNGPVAAVDGIDFDMLPGEVLGIVGESGSGKSVTLRSLLHLVNPPADISGQVMWRGIDLMKLSEAELRLVRGREIAAIFQEPMAALNPVLTIGMQIEESLEYNLGLTSQAARARAIELLRMVGIPDAAHRLKAYPHEFSGGMRQRAMIAIALATGPKLLLADEPTTALDVTIQDQILKLLLRLKRELEMAIILVTHDLSVVAQTCDRVAVLYAGRVAETGSVADIFSTSAHAYTLGLLRSVPTGHAVRKPLPSIPGVPPALSAEIAGCRFAPRCRFATDICRDGETALREISPGHHTACHHAARVIAEARAIRS